MKISLSLSVSLIYTSAVAQINYSVKGLDVYLSYSQPTLNCSFPMLKASKSRITWWFSKTNTTLISERVTNDTIIGGEIYWVSLTLTNLHDGWYFCKVNEEIPTLHTHWSNGINVLVGKCNQYNCLLFWWTALHYSLMYLHSWL